MQFTPTIDQSTINSQHEPSQLNQSSTKTSIITTTNDKKYALISVSDKANLEMICHAFTRNNIAIIASVF